MLVLRILLVPMLVLATSAHAAPGPTPNPVHVCAGKITTALRSYSEDVIHAVAGCRVKLLRTPGDGCAARLGGELANLARDLEQQIAGCSAEAAHALCPLEAKSIVPALRDAIAGDVDSVKSALVKLVDDLLVTEQSASCPRPRTVVTKALRECADRIAQSTETTTEQLQQCFFSCERANLVAANREPCVDDVTGDPLDAGVAQCVTSRTADVMDVANRCDVDEIVALGCPLGATRVFEFVERLADRLTSIAQSLNLRVFHSRCQGALPGRPTETTPALVTLEPSMVQKQLACGAVIDAAFMGRNSRISFDTDLDCGPSPTATDGMIVARSSITLAGRLRSRTIRGPSRSSLRTGAGIRLAPGVSRVRILNFKSIESFGVGIEDALEGDNKKVVIQKTTVRRNVQAGVRLRSPRTVIEQVTADKNGIGFDLSGDGTKLKASIARGSLYEPRTGIRLSGSDRNANGSVVTLKLNTVESNEGAGIEIAEGAHVLTQNTVRGNGGDGIVIQAAGAGSYVDSSVVKLNGRGIVVLGDVNRIDSNTCEQNFGAGFLVEGVGNVLEQNKSGKKTDRGNVGPGFAIVGTDTRLYANQAEANLGPGFLIAGTTAQFKGNGSQGNVGIGFDIQSAGNPLESCAAEANGGAEWLLAPCNLDQSGNRANGTTIAIPAGGGTCEGQGVCDPPP